MFWFLVQITKLILIYKFFLDIFSWRRRWILYYLPQEDPGAAGVIRRQVLLLILVRRRSYSTWL
jgi:hypothetical protein